VVAEDEMANEVAQGAVHSPPIKSANLLRIVRKHHSSSFVSRYIEYSTSRNLAGIGPARTPIVTTKEEGKKAFS
jgi:hypothetical protein